MPPPFGWVRKRGEEPIPELHEPTIIDVFLGHRAQSLGRGQGDHLGAEPHQCADVLLLPDELMQLEDHTAASLAIAGAHPKAIQDARARED